MTCSHKRWTNPARTVAEAFCINLGDASSEADWTRAVEIAKAGIEVDV